MKISEVQKKKLNGELCPYCEKEPEYVSSTVVYGKDRDFGMLYVCSPCKAYVGVHKGTTKPLGRLANKELREAKIKAHKYFDAIWNDGVMNRKGAYKWLSRVLNIPAQYTHIGMFNVKTCKEVVKWSLLLLQDMEKNDRNEINSVSDG